MTPAQISAALRDVQQRYEADAERQLQEMKNRAQREAVTDVLTLQREQLEQEANKGVANALPSCARHWLMQQDWLLQSRLKP
jgi:vacuolar-type H+-ATPase subunit E/Vma4